MTVVQAPASRSTFVGRRPIYISAIDSKWVSNVLNSFEQLDVNVGRRQVPVEDNRAGSNQTDSVADYAVAEYSTAVFTTEASEPKRFVAHKEELTNDGYDHVGLELI